jgi:G3E family GTPase
LGKIPVYLVTGFLGSGKTTFIQKVLNSYSQNTRIAVVQNEFAPLNFDGNELKRNTNKYFELLEVNNGSVFCICLLSGFIQSLQKFVEEKKPEIIFLETSGLSDPVSVGEVFNSPLLQQHLYLAGSVCIVDALNFMKIEKLQQRVTHQIQIANSVILNKIDLVSDFEAVLNKCRQLNPHAEIFSTTFCTIDFPVVFPEKVEPLSGSGLKFIVSAEDLGRPDIISAVFKSVKPIKPEKTLNFLNEISNRFIRLKGYLKSGDNEIIALQGVMGKIETKIIGNTARQTEIIAMGYELTAGDLKTIYQKYC